MTSSYIIIHTGYCSKVYVFTHVLLRTTLWENYHYHHAKDGTEDWGHWEGHTAHRRLEPSLLMDFWFCAVLTSLIFLPQPPVPGASGSVGSHFHLKRVCWDVFDSWWGLNFVLSCQRFFATFLSQGSLALEPTTLTPILIISTNLSKILKSCLQLQEGQVKYLKKTEDLGFFFSFFFFRRKGLWRAHEPENMGNAVGMLIGKIASAQTAQTREG